MRDMKQHCLYLLASLCLAVWISSCDWYYSAEEEPVAERSEVTEEFEEETAVGITDEELKQAMKASARYMRNLEAAMDAGNWTAARASAKKLEELIGQRCVNLYIKTYGSAPEEFVGISQDFYNHVLKLLVAERYNKYELARSHYESMKADCDDCHSKFREGRD